MAPVKFVYWKSDSFWLGYVYDFPAYWTQGETLDELHENLQDLCFELTNGNIPGVRCRTNT